MASNADTSAANDPAFDARHEKALGAKKFIATKAAETFIPLGAMGAGAAAGYYTLGKPIRDMFPTSFKVIDHAGDFGAHLRKLKSADLAAAYKKIETELGPDVIKKAMTAKPTLTPNTIEWAKELLHHVGEKEVVALKETMHIVSHGHGKNMSQWAGAAALGIVGSIIGGVFVGYDKWRKEESTRLAAAEIDRDISRLEIFNKRDPELVEENKRLRRMIETQEAEMPKKTTAEKEESAETGMEEEAPSARIGSAEHEGTVRNTHEKHR